MDAVITLSFAADQTIQDTAGNLLIRTAPTAANDNTFTLDHTAPTVVISGVASEIGLGQFTATITFSEAVSGFAQDAIVARNATLANFTGVDGDAVYTVEVTPTAAGALSLSIASGAAADLAGNLLSLTSTATSSAAAISIGFESANYSVVAGETLSLTLNTSLPLPEDVAVIWGTRAGTARAGSDYISPSVSDRTVLMTAGQSSATFDVEAVLNDADEGAENFAVVIVTLTPADVLQLNRATTTITIVAVDFSAPTVVSIARSSPTAARTTADSVTWRITFNEAVENVDANDFSLSGTTATLAATVLSDTAVDVTASGGDLADLDARITLRFAADQDIHNAAGRPLSNTIPSGVNDNSFSIDHTAPTVVISGVEVDGPNLSDTVSFTATITFSEDVSDFEERDIRPSDFGHRSVCSP